MFSQNTKKQTTLAFAPKPPAGGRTSAVESKARSTPYTRAPVSRQSSGSGSHTASKSPYFKANAVGAAKSYRAPRPDVFGRELSTAVNKYHRSGPPKNTQVSVVTTAQARKGHAPTVPLPRNVSLSDRQCEAFDEVVNKRSNIFITGSAGTGKSVLLREIITAFQTDLHMASDQIVVTASTGIAAFNIGGKTIHSFSGVGFGKGTPSSLLSFVKKSMQAVRRWKAVQVLIVDEVSMLDAALFDALEFIARSVRCNSTFFGGVQVILTGDFYQLPPVDREGMSRFAFESSVWTTGITKTVVLTHVFRQKDMRFVDMLNEIRLGRLSEHTQARFVELSRTPKYPDDGIQATELYSLRNQVESANHRRLQALEGKSIAFSAHDQLVTKDNAPDEPVTEETRKKIDGVTLALRRIEIRKFAQVMLIKNRPEDDLVNGSRGVVTGFKELAGREYPIVRFTNGVELLMSPEVSEVDISNKKYRRTQLPIILAWALSIHKSQGQTIERLLVDLGKVFEKGQAYVALSRAVNLESLQVLNFKPGCVMAHPRVIQYYADLSRKL